MCGSQTLHLVLGLCLPCQLLSLILLLHEPFLTTLLIMYNLREVGFLWFIGLIPRNGFYMAACSCLSSMNLLSHWSESIILVCISRCLDLGTKHMNTTMLWADLWTKGLKKWGQTGCLKKEKETMMESEFHLYFYPH